MVKDMESIHFHPNSPKNVHPYEEVGWELMVLIFV